MTAAVLVGRVGALAAALGAGVVIGLSVAAPASAEPTDSQTGARSDAAESGVRAGSGPRRGADTAESDRGSTRRTPAAASVDVDVVAPKATIAPTDRAARTTRRARIATDKSARASAEPIPAAATRTTRRARIATEEPGRASAEPIPAAVAQESRLAATATATAPVAVTPPAAMATASIPASSVPAPSVSAPGIPAPRAAAPTAGSGAGTPIANVLQTLFGRDPRGRLITIYKGTHFAIPNSFAYFTKKVGGTGTFTADTVYDLKDEDQYDWNKFTGIAFTPLEPDRNSVMVGWRYNLASQEFEIAPFYNVDKKRILPNEQTEVISVPAGETFDYAVDYSGVRISYGGTTVYKPYPEGLKPNVWTAARVSGWFGGNEVAPRTISYYLKFAR